MHVRVSDFLPLMVLLMWTSVAGLAREKPLADLEREANEVLSDPDNVSRRKRIAPVFELASRYATAGATNKALSFYAKGLEHHPWNLEAQMTVAELLLGIGDTVKAREKASLVFNRAEADALLMRATKVLGSAFESTLPGSEPWPANTNALALVPVGEVDGWLLRDLRRDLQGALQMPVIIQRGSMTIPKPERDALHLKAEDLRERIGKAKNDPAFQAMLRQHKLSTQGLDDDERVFALTEKILETERDKEQVSRFRDELAFLRRLGPQWDTVPLLDQVKQTFGTVGGSARGVLGVTKLDLYANQSRYVFGMAGNGMNCGIISYWRYRSALVE
nr:hypothetical protein [Verrucomicrobiota bacterium]